MFVFFPQKLCFPFVEWSDEQCRYSNRGQSYSGSSYLDSSSRLRGWSAPCKGGRWPKKILYYINMKKRVCGEGVGKMQYQRAKIWALVLILVTWAGLDFKFERGRPIKTINIMLKNFGGRGAAAHLVTRVICLWWWRR